MTGQFPNKRSKSTSRRFPLDWLIHQHFAERRERYAMDEHQYNHEGHKLKPELPTSATSSPFASVDCRPCQSVLQSFICLPSLILGRAPMQCGFQVIMSAMEIYLQGWRVAAVGGSDESPAGRQGVRGQGGGCHHPPGAAPPGCSSAGGREAAALLQGAQVILHSALPF